MHPSPRTATASASSPALNLLPVMNLVTILIPLLLMSAQLIPLAVIDSSLPAIGAPLKAPPAHDALVTPQLIIDAAGVTILGAEDVLTAAEARISTQDGLHDLAALQARLARIKRAHPGAEVVILVPAEATPYEILVEMMDTARQMDADTPLFPTVTLSGGMPG